MKAPSFLRNRAFFLPGLFRAVHGLAAAAVILLGLCAPLRADLDMNGITQQIWKLKFGVSDAQLADVALGGWMNQDTDGDGVKNSDEIAAGTNPLKAGSVVKITNITTGTTTVDITFPTEAGKKYFAQRAVSLDSGFTDAAVSVIGTTTATTQTLIVPKAGHKFFRVEVQDTDSDGDGTSDWAERVAGYDPNNPADGSAVVLNSALTASNVVTVSVTKPSATQPLSGYAPVETGSVTISRVGPLKFHTITVPLDVSGGSAVAGTDFDYVHPASPAALTSVTFPPLGSEVVLTINPKANAARKTNVTAIVKANAGLNYTLGTKTSGSVVIYPAGIANGTGLTAKYWNTSNSAYGPVNGANNDQLDIFATLPHLSRIDPVIDFGTSANTIVASIVPDGSQCVVTTTRATALVTGDLVTFAGVTGGNFTPAITGPHAITVTSSTTFTIPVTCNVVPTAVTSATIATASTAATGWGATAGPRDLDPDSTNGAFSVHWTGQILPKFSETYSIDFRSDDSGKVWVNGQLLIDRWTGQSPTDYVNTIALQAGILYDIQIDYWNGSGGAEAKLYWWSPSQTKEIIPQSRLFPAPETVAEKVTPIVSSLNATGYEGVAFNFDVSSPSTGGTTTYALAANSGPLPLGLTLNQTTGAIEGTPSAAPQPLSRGTYNVAINAVNTSAVPLGTVTGSSIVNITIFPFGEVTREILTATGPKVSDIVIPSPTVTPPHDTIPTIDTDDDYGLPGYPSANTSQRLRGYLVPPKTGNYYFWIAANNAAELWISNDAEYVNKVRRAWVTNTTGKKVWSPVAISGIAPGDPCTVTTAVAHGLTNGDPVQILGVTGGTFSSPINGLFNATVTGPATFTVPPNCTVGPTSVVGAVVQGPQRTAWLSLVAGERYYFEVLHNTGADADDHVAVGWCQDDIGTVPAAIGSPNASGTPTLLPDGGGPLQGYPLSGTVPRYIFQPYDYPPVTPPTGTLYACNLGPQKDALTSASGSANIQVNADETQAILRFKYQGLGSPKTSYHLHNDEFVGDDLVLHSASNNIIYDIDDADQNPSEQTGDGGYIWDLTKPVGSFANVAQIREALRKGKVYLNIHSVTYPAGEIRGTFNLIDGSQTSPDASLYTGANAPAATDYPLDAARAARFMNQATFGASPTDVAALTGADDAGISSWIANQINLPATRASNDVVAGLTADIFNPYPSSLFTDAWWKTSITGQDQLRQRLAFAFSEIMVVSYANNTGPLQNNGRILADYYDQLVDHCLPTSGVPDSGNFRGILKAVTLTPAMGLYLDMRANQKGDDTIGRHPNENYAREIMQLFSVGIYRMWDDGRFVLGADAGLVSTYTQPSIIGLSNLFTGWNYAQPNQGNGRAPSSFGPASDFLNPMVLVPLQHELSSKLLLNHTVSPAATGRTPRVSIASITPAVPNTNPCTVNTTTIHGLKKGDTIAIANVAGTGVFTPPTINATHQVTEIVDADSFKVGIALGTGTPTYTNAIVTGATVTPAAISGTGGISAISGSQADNSGTGANHPYDLYGLTELDRAIDNIVNNDNVPPYICRQLIQRLVTSDPSPGYVYRVVQKWKDNGSGVRGDLAAVVTAILLDGEARRSSVTNSTDPLLVENKKFGKQREPVMRLTGPARAFPAVPFEGTYTQLPADTVNAHRFRITTTGLNDFSNGFSVSLNFRSNYVTAMPSVPDPVGNPTSTTYSINATLGIAATHTDISFIYYGFPLETFIETAQPHGLNGDGLSGSDQVWFTGFSGSFSETINSGAKTVTKLDDYIFSVPITTNYVFQITNISAASPCVVTTTIAHDLPEAPTTATIVINGVNGGTYTYNVNGGGTASFSINSSVIATKIDATTFSITRTSGEVINCTSPPTSSTIWREVSNPCRVTTQVPHGLVTGNSVTISGVSGGSFTPNINGTPFEVTYLDLTSFTIASSCAAASTPNTGNIQGGKLMDVADPRLVNVAYKQDPGSNVLTVSTGGPLTNVAVPAAIVPGTTLKSQVYLDFLTATTSVVSIASVATGYPCTVTTAVPHGLVGGESVTISGIGTGTFSPSISNTYTVTYVSATQFSVLSNCTVAPTAGTGTVTGTSGGTRPADGIYSVESNVSSSSFTVITIDTPVSGRSGSVIVPKIGGSYTPMTSNTIVQFNNNINHNLAVGQKVWIDAPIVGSPLTDAEYTITLVTDEDHFRTSYLPVSSGLGVYPKPSGSNNGVTIYPLVAPPMGRSGNVSINQSTFNLGSTESTLSQSPLNAPTVFNFFSPDYKFPGTLANSGLDSPEFQLTTDTNVMNLTNSLTNMFIGTGGGNSNLQGLSSFNNGGGNVVMDIGSYLLPAKTNDGGIPGLIQELANLLVGAPLHPDTVTTIQKFVTGKRITAISTGYPCSITSVGHGLVDGASVTISGVTGGTFRNQANTANLAINATYTVAVTGPDTFTVPVNCTSISGLGLLNAGLPVYFPMNTVPTSQQMRDRVRAIIHLIITSAEFAVQK